MKIKKILFAAIFFTLLLSSDIYGQWIPVPPSGNNPGYIYYGANGLQRVGIGVTFPTSRLHVNGDLKLRNGTNISEISTDGNLSGNSDDAVPTEKAVKSFVHQRLSSLIANPESSYLAKFKNSILVKSEVFEHNGKVGIGTNTPERELHIGNGVIQVDRSKNSAALILRRKSGTDVLKSYTLGVNASGMDNGYFVIGENLDGSFAKRFVIDNDGKTGIGTVSPGSMLHVNGDLQLENGTNVNEISNDGTLIDDSDTAIPTEKAVKTYVDNQTGVIPNNDPNYITKFSGNTVVKSTVYEQNGNVGIGATSPERELHIGNGVMQIDRSKNTAGIILRRKSGTDVLKTFTMGVNASGVDNGYFVIGEDLGGSFAKRFVIDNDGKTGIGTVSPGSMLHVNGDLQLENGTNVNEISNDGTLIDDSDTAIPTEKAVKTYVDNQAGVIPNNDPNYITKFSGNTVVKSTVYEQNGNVGIGTTSPERELHIGNGVIQVDRSQNSAAVILRRKSGTDILKSYTLGVNASGMDNGYFVIGEDLGGSFAKRFVIDNDGKTGIGTVSPESMLHVNGDLQLENGTNINEISTDETLAGNSDDAVPTEKAVKAYVDSRVSSTTLTGDPNYLSKFSGGTLVESAMYEQSGKVGIGTTAPERELHIGNGVMQIDRSKNTAGIILRRKSGTDVLKTFTMGVNASGVDNGYFVIGEDLGGSFAKRFVIANDGKTGIGTVSPQEDLHVIGNVLASGSVTAFSDSRFKKGVKTLDNALDNVLKLRGVNYDMRTDEFSDYDFSEGKQIGFIAQEVEKVIPEVVITHDDGYKSLDYMKITPVLVEAIKEQQNIIDDQQTELETLENRVVQIEKMLQKLNGNDEEGTPAEADGILLNQNVPNPFSDMTTITYELENAGNIRLDIFDIMGRHIDSLISEYQDAGSHSVEWEADGIPSGLYIYTLIVDGKEFSRRAIISRS